MSLATITPRALAELSAEGKSFELIDVRTPVEYRELHVALARNVPLDQLDPRAMAQAPNGARQEPLYVICGSGGRSLQACKQLLKAGYTHAINVEGGTLAWAECGLPVVRGPKAISVERQVRITLGLLVLQGTALSWFVDPAFIALPAFIGAGLVFAGVTGTCALGLLLARMPWNQVREPSGTCGIR